MAYSSYRQNYKRRWIAAKRFTNRRNNTNTSTGVEVELPASNVSQQIFIKTAQPLHENDILNATPNDPLGSPDCTMDRVIDKHDIGCTSDEMHCYFSDSDSADEDSLLETELINWVNRFQVKHNAVDNLLKILKQHGHNTLPATARTLLGTIKIVNTEIKSGMQYHHLPLVDGLLKNFRSYPEHVRENVDSLEISINVDGIPLFKSSSSSMWPVLCGILNIHPVKIFPVTLTFGDHKPNDFI